MAAAITSGGEPDAVTAVEPALLITGREFLVLSVALATVLGTLLLLVITGAQLAAALSAQG